MAQLLSYRKQQSLTKQEDIFRSREATMPVWKLSVSVKQTVFPVRALLVSSVQFLPVT
jgi:hypothetical protein